MHDLKAMAKMKSLRLGLGVTLGYYALSQHHFSTYEQVHESQVIKAEKNLPLDNDSGQLSEKYDEKYLP